MVFRLLYSGFVQDNSILTRLCYRCVGSNTRYVLLFQLLFLTWFFSPNVCFYSKGAGDLNIQAGCRTLLSEIYEVEDCDYYSTTTYTSTTEINKTLLNSTACTVEFDLVKGTSSSGAYLHIGTDSNNFIGVGLIGSGYYGFLIQHNGSRETTQTDSSLGNGTFHTVLTYNNGSITCVINNKTKTYTFTQPISKVLKSDCWSSGQIKNIKVKPL